jgi:microcompartment protein CcmK/EutM
MILCKIIGTVTSTAKHKTYRALKLMVVEPVDHGGKPCGSSFLAVDSVSAGIGETVLVAKEGNTARQVLGDDHAPYYTVIVGIVDRIDFEDRRQK